ncbi:MAG: hypothetical protein BRC33_11170 [Cyanobacteria bacterium SW_9_44_58]|nr:MAG: hypothetical protein BRC33_11170 [Cyanobacteria bacterium SW_9_44_58]
MQYLLDTNICIYLIKQKPPKVLARFKTLALSDIGISSITVAELEYGVFDTPTALLKLKPWDSHVIGRD